MGEFFDDKLENFIRYMLGGYVTEKVGKAKENQERRKEENTIQEIVVIAEDLPTKEDYIEAVKEKEKPFQIEDMPDRKWNYLFFKCYTEDKGCCGRLGDSVQICQ